MTRFCPILLLPILFMLSSLAVTAQSVETQSNRSKLEQIEDFSLKGDAKAEFKKFRRKAEYFGSIYVNRRERIAGSYWNAHNIGLADFFARAACRAQSKDPNQCLLYARVKPRRFSPPPIGYTLSRDANIEFKEYKRLQNEERYGAFAISDSGAVGYSWAEATPRFAEKEALKRCAKSARKLLRNTDDLLKPILSNPARQGCRLIHWSG